MVIQKNWKFNLSVPNVERILKPIVMLTRKELSRNYRMNACDITTNELMDSTRQSKMHERATARRGTVKEGIFS